MRHSDDQTLFAWELEPQLTSSQSDNQFCGPLATSPSQFRGCSKLVPTSGLDLPSPYSITNKGLRIELPVLRGKSGLQGLAILQCTTQANRSTRLTLPVIYTSRFHNSHLTRDPGHTGALSFLNPMTIPEASMETIFMRQEPGVQLNFECVVKICTRRPDPFDINYLVTDLLNPSLEKFDRNTYLLPSTCDKGALVFVNKNYHLVILFKIDHEGFDCKMLCAIPHDDYDDRSADLFRQFIYKSNVTFNASGTPTTTLRFDNQVRLDELYEEFTSSHARDSFLDLPEDRAVFASNETMYVRGTRMLRIDIRYSSHPVFYRHLV
jgi:hypothetical protein